MGGRVAGDSLSEPPARRKNDAARIVTREIDVRVDLALDKTAFSVNFESDMSEKVKKRVKTALFKGTFDIWELELVCGHRIRLHRPAMGSRKDPYNVECPVCIISERRTDEKPAKSLYLYNPKCNCGSCKAFGAGKHRNPFENTGGEPI